MSREASGRTTLYGGDGCCCGTGVGSYPFDRLGNNPDGEGFNREYEFGGYIDGTDESIVFLRAIDTFDSD